MIARIEDPAVVRPGECDDHRLDWSERRLPSTTQHPIDVSSMLMLVFAALVEGASMEAMESSVLQGLTGRFTQCVVEAILLA